MPASTARNLPIVSYSSWLSRKLSAGAISSTCSALRPPTMAAVMAGWCSVQATATTPGLTPCPLPISRSSSTRRRLRLSRGSLNSDVSAPPVVGRKAPRALGGHLAGEQARNHGRVVDDADAVGLREGKNLRLDGAAQHGVGRLQAGDGRDLLCALHLLDGEIGNADPAELALLAQARQRLPSLFDFDVGIGPVNLVEVDGFDLQAAAARPPPLRPARRP